MIKTNHTYTIKGDLYLNYSSGAIRVEQVNEFNRQVDRLLRQLFNITEDVFIFLDIEHDGKINAPGRYAFPPGDKRKMNRILEATMQAAAHEAGIEINGEIYFQSDAKVFTVRE